VPGARKDFKGKEMGAEAKCQEQGNNLKEKIRKQSEEPGAWKKFKRKR
jgi:hypothetical protein